MTIEPIRLRTAGYPARLAQIHDPPRELWFRGVDHLAVLERPCVAVVGARVCSAYGRTVARSLSRELAAAGAVVVSGMARGIDGEAHRGALEGGGPTVAVLGCGIDRDYPAAHAELARRIVGGGGLVVSEYEPGVEPAPWRFPARNRIISGLSLAVVVVEARERSGALITADFALEQGRDVLAVPGEITSALSGGSNGLLRQGAAPVTRVLDVLEAVGLAPAAPSQRGEFGPVERAVLEALADGPRSVDAVARVSGVAVGAVSAAVCALELAGVVAVDDGEVTTTIAR